MSGLAVGVIDDVFYVVGGGFYNYKYTPIGYSDSNSAQPGQTTFWSASLFVIALTTTIIASVVIGTTLLILHIRRKPNKKTAQAT